MNWIGLVLVLVGGIILTAGDLFMKKWVNTGSPWLYVIGMAIYIVGLNFLAQSFKFKNIAVASVIFVLFNVITLLLFSWFYFKEKLSGMEMFGLALGLASIIILELFGKG